LHAAIDYQGPKPICDWWGVNYYARGVVGPFLTPKFPKGEVMTDMQYTLYPKGLYECLVRGSQLGVPMYVSEIGSADRSEDDHVRVTHVSSFTNQVRASVVVCAVCFVQQHGVDCGDMRALACMHAKFCLDGTKLSIMEEETFSGTFFNARKCEMRYKTSGLLFFTWCLM
jgi:hypothetical protein